MIHAIGMHLVTNEFWGWGWGFLCTGMFRYVYIRTYVHTVWFHRLYELSTILCLTKPKNSTLAAFSVSFPI